jgi:hypothetical protein
LDDDDHEFATAALLSVKKREKVRASYITYSAAAACCGPGV